MTLIIISITLVYLALIGILIIGFDKVKYIDFNPIEASTGFSVIIPFKNEASNLPELLESISKLDYPKHLYEIILVNDDSNDNSESIIMGYVADARNDISVINNKRKTNSPKKDAINTAISQAKHDWIVTTDADCVVTINWLNCFNNFIKQNELNLIVAPVTYQKVNSFLKRFQILDFFSLIGGTIGGFGIGKPFLCNGANLAYKKNFFKEINGFEGNSNIASGDDIFLLEKAIKHLPEKVLFLKSRDVTVKTLPQPDFNSLLSQRVRWAAKTSSYNNWFGKLTGLIVLLMNALLICCLVFVLIDILNTRTLVIIFILKFVFDLMLIYKTAHFFNQKKYLSAYLFSSLIYPFFSVYVAIISSFKGYKWKGHFYKK